MIPYIMIFIWLSKSFKSYNILEKKNKWAFLKAMDH